MKRAFALAAILALTSLQLFADDSSEWTPLFEGAAYEDFYFNFIEETDPKEVFEFKDDSGLLIKGKDKPIGFIQTLDEYSNYELEFQWRWPDKPGNSGIQLHSSSFPAFSIWPESIEVQMEEGNVGDFWLLNQKIEVEESRVPKKAAERNRRLKIIDKEKKPGEWNDMRIVAKGDTLKVYLNGELVNEGVNASATSGYITIQAEEANIEFREFRMRQLETETEAAN